MARNTSQTRQNQRSGVLHTKSAEDTSDSSTAILEPLSAVLVIPGVCPSVNALLSGKLRDRIRVKDDWQMATWVAWIEAGKPRFMDPVTVDVRIYFPTARKRDWPNFMAGGVKIMIDQLVQCGCLECGDDDDVLDMQRPEMVYSADNPRVELRIRERSNDCNGVPVLLDALTARNAALAAERDALHLALDKADILYGTFSITVDGTKLVYPDGTTHTFENKVIVGQRQWMEMQHALAVFFGMLAANQLENKHDDE